MKPVKINLKPDIERLKAKATDEHDPAKRRRLITSISLLRCIQNPN